MKVGKFFVEIFKKRMISLDKNRLKKFNIDRHYRSLLDVPYLNDEEDHHRFDVFYADEDVRRKIVIIDIHGGTYIFGSRKNAVHYQEIFLNQGFDFIALDYLPNDGHHNIENIISDCVEALNYIAKNLKELGLEDCKFVLTGDSAGGHISLLLAELLNNEGLSKKLGLKIEGLNFDAVLVNCPVYMYEIFADDNAILNKNGIKRIFGPKYLGEDGYKELYSPHTHIEDIKIPVFISTCKRDFLRHHSLALNEDLDKLNNVKHYFIDIDSDDKLVDHVHNVVEPDLEVSIEVNQKMIDFILEVING